MLEIGFFNIAIHILNFLCYIGIAAWVFIGVMWLVRRVRSKRRV